MTDRFSILHIADIPKTPQEKWSLKIGGEVDSTVVLSWAGLMAMDTLLSVSDFHCVTDWSRLDNKWTGVRIRDVLALARPKSSVRYVTFRSADGYTTSLPLSDCTGEDDILAFRWEGALLGPDRGGPVRAIVPSKYGYKSAMRVVELKVTSKQESGYWEQRGDSQSADSWKEERYR